MFTLTLLLNLSPSYSQVVVVVAKDSVVGDLNNQQVANIFLSKTNRYPNGNKAMPIELKNNGIRTRFYQSISGKTNNQLNAYWTTLVFTGKGKPPKTLSDTDKLIMQLFKQPGSITYLLATEVTDDMRVVYKFP